jgi:hypothetical protein
MNTKGVNFQPSKRGQFSAAVDSRERTDPSGYEEAKEGIDFRGVFHPFHVGD